MSSRVAQRHAAGSYDSCDSRVSASGRLAALVAALMIALATLFVGIAMPTNSVASAIISAATSAARRPEAETRESHES